MQRLLVKLLEIEGPVIVEMAVAERWSEWKIQGAIDKARTERDLADLHAALIGMDLEPVAADHITAFEFFWPPDVEDPGYADRILFEAGATLEFTDFVEKNDVKFVGLHFNHSSKKWLFVPLAPPTDLEIDEGSTPQEVVEQVAESSQKQASSSDYSDTVKAEAAARRAEKKAAQMWAAERMNEKVDKTSLDSMFDQMVKNQLRHGVVTQAAKLLSIEPEQDGQGSKTWIAPFWRDWDEAGPARRAKLRQALILGEYLDYVSETSKAKVHDGFGGGPAATS